MKTLPLLALVIAAAACDRPAEAPPQKQRPRLVTLTERCAGRAPQDTLPSTDACVDSLEAIEMARSPAHPVREGLLLRIPVTGAPDVQILDDTTEAAYMRQRYAGYIPELRAHVVEVLENDAFRQALVNDSTGEVLGLESSPILSPNATRFAVVNAGSSETVLEVWDNDHGRLTKRLTVPYPDPVGAVEWSGENTLSWPLPSDAKARRMKLEIGDPGFTLKPVD